MRRGRALAAAVALAAAAPATAYVLNVSGILRHMGDRRHALSLGALEVTGSLLATGEVAEALARTPGIAIEAGQRAPGAANPAGQRAPVPASDAVQVNVPAIFRMKVPGRCRLEVAPAGVPEASRPYVAIRDGRISGWGGLDRAPSAVAFIRAVCALLATDTGGDASEGYAATLSRRGVALSGSTLGRFDGRIAYVVGGRPREPKPLLFVEKDGFRPLRLVAQEGGARHDVRLLGWGSPTGGDWFPRAVEDWTADTMRLRFTTERAVPNARLADALFP
jgi:hypothetical protein